MEAQENKSRKKWPVGKYVLGTIIIFIIASFGLRLYNDKVSGDRSIQCAQLASQARTENRSQMVRTGQDKTDLYEDEFAYNKKLRKCIYYQSRTPLVYNPEGEALTVSSKKIIDLFTNREMVTFIEFLNYEGTHDSSGCISFMKSEYPCETKADFQRVMNELLYQN